MTTQLYPATGRNATLQDEPRGQAVGRKTEGKVPTLAPDDTTARAGRAKSVEIDTPTRQREPAQFSCERGPGHRTSMCRSTAANYTTSDAVESEANDSREHRENMDCMGGIAGFRQSAVATQGRESLTSSDTTLVAPCASKASLVAKADCIRVPAHELTGILSNDSGGVEI